ncbi:MAG: CoB--CoM heterodisulfide reductase iron-sulfur subunit B family protein [Nitrospirota bacterium]
MSNQANKIAYYPGCSLHASSKLYDIQCRLVLSRLGITLQEIENWNCCGASAANAVDDFLAFALSARNLGIAAASGLSEMIIPCSSCYSRTMIAQQKLFSDSAFKDAVNAELVQKVQNPIKISNILEVLVRHAANISQKAMRQLSSLKPVCYYGCLLTRFPCEMKVADTIENPTSMEMLCEFIGAQPIDWNYKTDCCGASTAITDPKQADLLMSKIVDDAIARGANCFVTSCPLCQLNLDAYQAKLSKTQKQLPVYFITELVGFAMGIDAQEMQVDRHLTEAMTLLNSK